MTPEDISDLIANQGYALEGLRESMRKQMAATWMSRTEGAGPPTPESGERLDAYLKAADAVLRECDEYMARRHAILGLPDTFWQDD